MNKLADRLNRPHYIYKWTNLINNKTYIGMTVNWKQRQHQYKSAAKNNGTDPITKAHIKYGFENFTFELIAFFDNFDGADMAEPFYIDYYKSRIYDNGYNVCPRWKWRYC